MIHHALHDTRAALDLLVKHGYLRKESITGADPIFRLNTERQTDALSFVREDATAESENAVTEQDRVNKETAVNKDAESE